MILWGCQQIVTHTLTALVQRYPSTPSVEPLPLDHASHSSQLLALVRVSRALSCWIRICLLSGVTLTSTQPDNHIHNVITTYTQPIVILHRLTIITCSIIDPLDHYINGLHGDQRMQTQIFTIIDFQIQMVILASNELLSSMK